MNKKVIFFLAHLSVPGTVLSKFIGFKTILGVWWVKYLAISIFFFLTFLFFFGKTYQNFELYYFLY